MESLCSIRFFQQIIDAEEKQKKVLSVYINFWVLFSHHLTISFGLFAGKFRGLYDSYPTTNGRLSLRPSDQDFREDEDRCGGECDSDCSYNLVLSSVF